MISDPFIGFMGFILLIALILLGFPIGFTMALTGIAGLLVVTDLKSTMWAVDSIIFHESFHWTYIVLPMFFLLGYFAFHGGIGKDAYDAFYAWLGKVKGSLIIATIAACTVMGFASGSSLATAASFTKIALPEMRRQGYNDSLCCGAIASAGTLAALIPPSGMMVIICIMTGMSLGKLMIAGIIPGIVTALAFVITVRIVLHMKPEWAPISTAKIPLKDKIMSLTWFGPLFGIVVFIFVGIYMGIFTPTEAGALGALATFVVFILRKGIRGGYREIIEALTDTVKVSAMIFIIIIGAMIFSRFLATSGFIESVSQLILSFRLPRHFILISILIIWLILGLFMEVVGILTLTIPVFYPVLLKLGFDEILIGILALMCMEMGVITPPVGTNAYVVKTVAGDVSLEQVFRGIFPFFGAYVVVLALIVAFPTIALWLPAFMKFK
jgi:C4-dicarboxylate transporter DctM subunit